MQFSINEDNFTLACTLWLEKWNPIVGIALTEKLLTITNAAKTDDFC